MIKRLLVVLFIAGGIVFVPYLLGIMYDSIGMADIYPNINFVVWLAGVTITMFICVFAFVTFWMIVAAGYVVLWGFGAILLQFFRLIKYIIKG